jgi:hypothetical protein
MNHEELKELKVQLEELLTKGYMSQPDFEGSVRSPFTLPKMGLGSPPGFSKTQNLIARVKTPCIEVFLISLERS